MLVPGDKAPDFTLKDQNWQPVSLADYRDKKNVLLVFFPLAFTGICQGELDEIRDNLPQYENDETATLAISVGPPPTHKIWALQSGYLFPVLSDFWPHGEVAQQYGVFNETSGCPTAARSWWTSPGSCGSPNARNPARRATRRSGHRRWRPWLSRELDSRVQFSVACHGTGV